MVIENIYQKLANNIYEYLANNIKLPKFYYQFIESESEGLLFTLEPTDDLPSYYSDDIQTVSFAISLYMKKYDHLYQLNLYQQIISLLFQKTSYPNFDIKLMRINDIYAQKQSSLQNFIQYNKLNFDDQSQTYNIKLELLIKYKKGELNA